MSGVTLVPAPIAPGPAVHALAYTAGTAVALSTPSRYFICGTAGNLVCTFNADTDAVTLAVVAGAQYEISVKSVGSGSTAAGVFVW